MLTLFAASVVAIVGGLILWSNPGRSVNRVIFTCSLHVAAWLFMLYSAFATTTGVFWLKTACAVSAWVPFHYWLVKGSIAGTFDFSWRAWLRQGLGWIVVSVGLAIICYTEAFIPSHSTPTNRIRGWGYYGYMLGVLTLYVYVFRDAVRDIKSLTGGRRMELQVWLGGGLAMAFTILALMGINAVTNYRINLRLQPLVVLVFFAGTMVAITTRRVFDARQIILVVVEKILLVALSAAVAFGIYRGASFVLPVPFELFLTTALSLWFAAWLNGQLDRLFRFYPQATAARQAAFAVARTELKMENLESAFGNILKGWGHSEHAVVLTGGRESWHGRGIELTSNSPAGQAIRQMRWATPERLARERSTPDRQALAEFLMRHAIGVLVVAEGAALSALIGVGVGASRRPFTYPQVTQLIELASVMEAALERAHFSAKMQHAEQLATVGLLGASLAHEIRNPLVSIKTFVQLLPTHHHDAVFRQKFFRLIGDEVGRIDQLTEQLLDLASPRTYSAHLIELHPVLRASLDLVAAKAAHKQVQFLTEFQALPDLAFTDASAAKQVMLNLCFNALQAVESQESGDRWVKIVTRNTSTGIEMSVADSGPGIAADIRPRLFQPFQTTKSSGFGLGLAICSDILANLNASIAVDPPEPGRGATFRVTFPCQPLSS